jgi:anthranilate 1,2-dioxygenase large subunit
LRAIRIKQANFVGPAGYISMEDGHAAELVQQAIVQDQESASFIEFGGRGMESEENLEENLLTESAIRGFWQYYREVMHL